MKSWRLTISFLMVVLCPLMTPVASATDGNMVIGTGAVQSGMAGAGIASPKDATWIFLNPASMVLLDKRLDTWLQVFDVKIEGNPEGLPIFINSAAPNMKDRQIIPNPGFAMVIPRIEGRSAWGFGVFGTQGDKVEFPEPRTGLALLENADRRAHLIVAKFPVSYARKFDNGWAVGGSIVGVFSMLRSDSLTLQLRPTSGNYAWDTSFGYGFQVAVHKRWDKWAFGATYTTRQWMTKFKKYDDLLRWTLDQPQQLQAGVAWQATEKLELMLDYKWIDWSGPRQIGTLNILGGLNWEDQEAWKFGAEYEINDRWAFRAGFSHAQSAVKQEGAFLNMMFPGIVEDHVTCGLSYTPPEKKWELHFALEQGLKNSIRNHGRGDLFAIAGAGTSNSLEITAATVQFSWKF